MHGALEVKQHPYFTAVDWGRLREMNAPFKPVLTGNTDTTYFPTDEIPQDDHSAEREREAAEINQDHEPEMILPFIGYTYKRFS